MVVYKDPKRTPIDEVELYLGLLKIQYGDLIQGRSYKEVSNILNNKFNILSTEEDINLLYEPTISDMEFDLRLQFEAMNLYY